MQALEDVVLSVQRPSIDSQDIVADIHIHPDFGQRRAVARLIVLALENIADAIAIVGDLERAPSSDTEGRGGRPSSPPLT